PQLVLIFGEKDRLLESDYFEAMKELFSDANIVSASTSGEIIGRQLLEDSITATVVEFEKTEIFFKEFSVSDYEDSKAMGVAVGNYFQFPKLKGLFLISDGLLVNGSYLLEGIYEEMSENVHISGGMAGDQQSFESTLVGLNKIPESGKLVTFGLVGDSILIGNGAKGGWDAFGPKRLITKSKDNVLYELDGEPALDLYIKYLGSHADNLPESALFFPLLLNGREGDDKDLVRTILGVDRDERSLVFAGNVPEGDNVRLMKGNMNKIINASAIAGEISLKKMKGETPELALLVSCVGRKLILGQMTEEEIEEAVNSIGEHTYYCGFYSYGEFSPNEKSVRCQLQNETMCITTFKEL
ncbi:MAG: FIST C-terminal domain-containing protein, partial [Flavobacteriales bacterium]|nr:FIST C-terminal domain-containing protein [Flavobacteriales bacterium]